MSSSDSTWIPVDALRDLCARALVRARTSESNAKSVADMLVAAEADGQGGHGVRRLTAYAAQARAGKVDGFAVPRTRKARAAVLEVDACSGFAAPALEMAAAAVAELAQEQGIAAAGIFRSHHSGRLGRWTEMMAQRGVLGIGFSNSPPAMTAWGGHRPLLGTNPISFAVPRLEGGIGGEEVEVEGTIGSVLVADLSLSRMARGKMMAAAQQGLPIPSGMALDVEGNPTTDAESALAGSLLPMGEAKGYALALLVEILCAPLAGGNWSFASSSFFNAEGAPPHIGQFLIAIAPHRSDFGGRLETLLRELENEPGARLPGAGLRDRRALAAERGVKISTQLRDDIEMAAKDMI